MGFLDPNSWSMALSDDPTGSIAASNTQAASQQAAMALQQQQYQTQLANQAPWLASGTNAVNTLSYLMGTPMSSLNFGTGTALGTTLSDNKWATEMTGNYNQDMQNPDVAAKVNQMYQQHLQSDPMGAQKHAGGWHQEEYKKLLANKGTALQTYNNALNQQQQQQQQGSTSLQNQLSAAGLTQGSLLNAPQVDVYSDPSYKFRLQQGIDAITAAGAAAGNLGSGNLGTALTNYGQGYASQEYQNAYNRAVENQANLYNRLAGLAGTGQVSANTLANVGSNTSTNMSNLLSSMGANYGNAITANRAAAGQGVSNLSNALSSGLNNYMQYQQQQNAMNMYNNYGSYGGYTAPQTTMGSNSLWGDSGSLANNYVYDTSGIWGE